MRILIMDVTADGCIARRGRMRAVPCEGRKTMPAASHGWVQAVQLRAAAGTPAAVCHRTSLWAPGTQPGASERVHGQSRCKTNKRIYTSRSLSLFRCLSLSLYVFVGGKKVDRVF
jgi:hypothetical protein